MRVVSCCVVYANIRLPHKNLSDLSLFARCGNVVLALRLLSLPGASDLMVPGFGRSMQLLRGEIDRIHELAVYVRSCFSANRQRSYECGWCEVLAVRIYSNSHNFTRSACTRIQIGRIKIVTVC